MLNKCANPVCTEEFRSLRQGRLFVAEVPLAQSANQTTARVKRKPERLEYFWLCDHCCKTMRAAVDRAHPLMESPKKAPTTHAEESPPSPQPFDRR